MRTFRARTLVVLTICVSGFGPSPTYAETGTEEQEASKLYNRCTGLNLLVSDMSGDARRIGLTKAAVVAAVESRLRGARLISDEHTGEALFVVIQVMALGTSDEVVFSIALSLGRLMEDNGFGNAQVMGAWEDGSIGIAHSTDQFVLGSLSKVIDRFVSSYLRANGAVCKMKARDDFDGLLALEGITLERYRREFPNAEDHGLAQMVWWLGGRETGLDAGEFCRQFLELPKGEECPIRDFGTLSGQ